MKKIQTRIGIFETNSSSTHSLTIAEYKEGDILDTIYPDYTGLIKVYPNEFGWEFKTYSDPMTKLQYLSIYARDWVGNDSEKYFKIIENVVLEHVGNDRIKFLLNENEDNGYIDHQSVENRDLDYLFEDPELIRQFIFNPRSVLKTGNDNG